MLYSQNTPWVELLVPVPLSKVVGDESVVVEVSTMPSPSPQATNDETTRAKVLSFIAFTLFEFLILSACSFIAAYLIN